MRLCNSCPLQNRGDSLENRRPESTAAKQIDDAKGTHSITSSEDRQSWSAKDPARFCFDDEDAELLARRLLANECLCVFQRVERFLAPVDPTALASAVQLNFVIRELRSGFAHGCRFGN
jgi:hypothetical protein